MSASAPYAATFAYLTRDDYDLCSKSVAADSRCDEKSSLILPGERADASTLTMQQQRAVAKDAHLMSA
jgi:hypothetical protein